MSTSEALEAIKSSIERRIERNSIATSGSGGSLSENTHQTLKQTLLTRLLDAVKQCQGHFGRKKQLATDDTDTRICFLLAQLEAIFNHGIRKSPSTLRQITEIVTRLSLSDLPEGEISLWSIVRCIISDEENKRFLRLTKVNTDVGRGRAWIRNSLNERTLQKSLETILNNKDLLEQFYEEWAFLRDAELTATLPQIAQGLSTIVFAIGIDNPELNSKSVQIESSDLLVEAKRAPQPIMSLSQTGKRAQSKERAKRRRKPLVNVVSFDDSKQKFSESEGTMKVQRQRPSLTCRSNSESLASLLEDSNSIAIDTDEILKPKFPLDAQRSISTEDSAVNQNAVKPKLPENVLRSGSNSGALSRNDSQTEDFESVFSEALSDETQSASGLNESFDSSAHKIGENSSFAGHSVESEGEGPRLTLLDGTLQLLSGDSVSESSKLSNELPTEEPSGIGDNQQPDTETIEYLRAELDRVRLINQDLSISFEAKLKASACENELLRNQLRGYVEAIQALKKERRKQIDKEEEAMTENGTADDQEATVSSDIYEDKLIQVAQMHAELMEFNDHLIRDLNRKKRKIVRLRDELTELRGPLLEDYSDDEGDNASSGDPDQRKRQPLVNLWIPSSFMTGKGTDVHSVYQVYVRIRNAEWNVYRRYKDFYEFHQKLKKEDSKIAQFNFPPKKTIGKKEKKFIEERRKQLEAYLRSAVNYSISQFPEFSAIPVNKDTLIKHFGFFGDGSVSLSGSKILGSSR